MTNTRAFWVIMRIELYKLRREPTNFDVLGRLDVILKTPLKDRNRARNADFIRLETHEQRGNLWLCDFVKIRMDHGPSKAGLSVAAKGFDLRTDEGFGEETAFLWDSTNDWCVVQYNHYGVRPTAIAEYLSLFVHENPALLELLPKLDDKIQAKINAKKLVTKFVLSVAPKEISGNDYDLGAGLGDAAKALKKSDADHVEIIITAAKRHGGLDLKLPDFMNWLKKLGPAGDDHSPVTVARATAAETQDDEPETLDLLHHRITADSQIQAGRDKRYPRKERWDAIHQAHTAWKT